MKRSKGILRFSIINVVFFLFLSPLVIFYGPFNSLQLFAVGAIATSRHVQNVDFFLTKEKYEELIKTYSKKKITVEPVILSIDNQFVDGANGIQIEEIKERYFKGKVMLIKNPTQVKIAVTNELGSAGERLSELVAANGAIAGINGGKWQCNP